MGWRKQPPTYYAYTVRRNYSDYVVVRYFPEDNEVVFTKTQITEKQMDDICEWWINRKKEERES